MTAAFKDSKRSMQQVRRDTTIHGGLSALRNGCILGWACNEAHPSSPRRLKVTVAGRSYECASGYEPTALGIFGKSSGSGFVVPLHGVEGGQRVFVEVADQETGATIGAGELLYEPVVHANGNAASEILQLQAGPLSKLQYFSFQGDVLTLFGFAQSAFNADRSSLIVDVPAGAAAKVQASIPAPQGHDLVYWYMPGAEFSGLAVDIDLSTLAPQTEDVEVAIRHRGRSEDVPRRLANTTWWPCRLDAYGPYPGIGQLERVHSAEDRRSVALSGYSDARRIEELYKHYAGTLAGKRVLDWGCGHGRVIRHLRRQRNVMCYGADIDADNIGWAQRHIPAIGFAVSSLMPPLPWDDESFDLVYGISVMTHLMPEVQLAWLAELRRVTRKGGHCILTYAGDASVAYSSRFLPPAWIEAYRSNGWNWSSYDNFTGSAEPEYYRNVHQTTAAVRDLLTAHFDIVAMHDRMFGYQDVAVLSR
jgi:ubiquinone/menaquinone biosynthesis C-methylase UbiE